MGGNTKRQRQNRAPALPSRCRPHEELGLRPERDAEAHWTAHWATIGNRRSLVDRALFGRLSGSQARAFDYLLGVYRRCEEARGRFSSATPAATAEVHAHVSELCVSYASLALTTPSMFNESAADDEG